MMEAKARKKIKMVRAAQKASNKADQISNDSDLSDKVCSAVHARGVGACGEMRRCVDACERTRACVRGRAWKGRMQAAWFEHCQAAHARGAKKQLACVQRKAMRKAMRKPMRKPMPARAGGHRVSRPWCKRGLATYRLN